MTDNYVVMRDGDGVSTSDGIATLERTGGRTHQRRDGGIQSTGLGGSSIDTLLQHSNNTRCHRGAG